MALMWRLDYTPQNKPFIRDSSAHISISHSHDKLAIILNRHKNTGIDIELLRDKILTVRHKFLTAGEQDFAGEDVQKTDYHLGGKRSHVQSAWIERA